MRIQCRKLSNSWHFLPFLFHLLNYFNYLYKLKILLKYNHIQKSTQLTSVRHLYETPQMILSLLRAKQSHVRALSQSY